MTQVAGDFEGSYLAHRRRSASAFRCSAAEHLIRFFPIEGTPVESLVSDTRRGSGVAASG
jgi:hypothetical protein